LKILLVEDDTFIGESIKDYFEMQGNRVDYYSSPKKALEEIYPSNYDIFLIDINMPEMNGYDFYNELKNYASEVPVIFITAHAQFSNRIGPAIGGRNRYNQRGLMRQLTFTPKQKKVF